MNENKYLKNLFKDNKTIQEEHYIGYKFIISNTILEKIIPEPCYCDDCKEINNPEDFLEKNLLDPPRLKRQRCLILSCHCYITHKAHIFIRNIAFNEAIKKLPFDNFNWSFYELIENLIEYSKKDIEHYCNIVNESIYEDRKNILLFLEGINHNNINESIRKYLFDENINKEILSYIIKLPNFFSKSIT
jgi:hypothetical protein